MYNNHNIMVDRVFLNLSVTVAIAHACVIAYPPGETYTIYYIPYTYTKKTILTMTSFFFLI